MAPQFGRVFKILLPLMLTVVASSAHAQVRIGDPESVYDSEPDDSRFPQMKEWAKAGVLGGIPRVENVLRTLGPDDDLVAALNQLESELGDATSGPHGVVLLQPGEYELNNDNIGVRRGVVGTFALVWLPQGIVLRGADPSSTTIRYRVTLDTDDKGERKSTRARYAFGLRQWSAVENLTLVNAVVEDLDPATYLGKYESFDVPGGKIGGVGAFGGAAADPAKPLNAWVQNCRILKSGSHPVMIETSTHVTLRDNVVDASLNKGDGGQGYYFLFNAMYVLVFNETISNIRHVSIQNCQYCVLHTLSTSVDVNWHAGDAMRFALLERSTINLPDFHPWDAIEHYMDPVKEGNLIYQTGPDWLDGIWALREDYDEEPWIYEMSNGVPPRGDTPLPGDQLGITTAWWERRLRRREQRDGRHTRCAACRRGWGWRYRAARQRRSRRELGAACGA